MTALHLCTAKKNYHLVEMLLSYGANTEIVNNDEKKSLELSSDEKIIQIYQK